MSKQDSTKKTLLTSFPWYDLPSVQWANDQFWAATGLPGQFSRDIEAATLWSDARLLVSQACGLDLFCTNAPIEPVAAPVFDLLCDPGHYFSYIVGDPEGEIAAVNSLNSRSGLSALLTECQPNTLLLSGSHTASLAALRSGEAAVAAIDAVTWQILLRDTPELLDGIAIAGQSRSAPAPPFVMRRGGAKEQILDGLSKAMSASGISAARSALLLRDMMTIDRETYDCIRLEYLAIEELLAGCTLRTR